MGLPEKLYYTMEEVAVRWNKTVDDLWHYAAGGKFFLSIWYKGYCFEEDFVWTNEADSYREFEIDDGYDRPVNYRFQATALDGITDITKETALEFITLPLKEFINTSYLMINNKPRVLAFRTSTANMPCSLIEDIFLPDTVKIEKKMVVVAFKEVKRMEEKHPELLSKAPGQLYVKAPWQSQEQHEHNSQLDQVFDIAVRAKELKTKMGPLKALPLSSLTIKEQERLELLQEKLENLLKEPQGPRENDVTNEQVEADFFDGRDTILDFFGPATWNTVKKWVEEYGIQAPDKGCKWSLKIKDACAIKAEKKNYYKKKHKK